MPVIEAVVSSSVHGKTLGASPDLIPVHNNLGSSFFLYRNLISANLSQQTPVANAETEALLEELHGNMSRYWYESFNPAMQDGYRLGSSKLSDEFVQAAAGKQTGEAAVQINKVSDKAFIEGYNAALNKGWERAVAWERISEAYGLDTAQMRKWVTGYPTEGYHPDSIPKASRKSLMKMLFDRSERIAGHELWSALQMAKQLEFSEQINDGILPTDAQKVWATAHDELVCQTCGPMDGASIAVNEQFVTQDGYFYAPPAHINCRCSIQMFLPNVVTKRMGDDKYDRNKKGQFASTEGRSVSPFITESDPNNWPDAGFVAARPSDRIPEKIDHKQEKKDAEEIIGSLRNSEIDEHVDPITQRDAKENEKLHAQTQKRVKERTQEMQLAQEEEEMQRALQVEEERVAILNQQRAKRSAATKKKKAAETAQKAEFDALFAEAQAQRAEAQAYFARNKGRPKAGNIAEILERDKADKEQNRILKDTEWVDPDIQMAEDAKERKRQEIKQRLENDDFDVAHDPKYHHDVEGVARRKFAEEQAIAGRTSPDEWAKLNETGKQVTLKRRYEHTKDAAYDPEADKKGKQATKDARARGLTVERVSDAPKSEKATRVGHTKTHMPIYETKTYEGRFETDIVKRLKSLFNKQVR